MKRWVATITIAALCGTSLLADVTITSTTSMEGGTAAMMGGMTPKSVTRIKGNKARTDIDVSGQMVATLMDLQKKEIYMLRPDQKTAQLLNPTTLDVAMPKVEASYKPTGQKKTIEGAECDEYTFTVSMDMSQMGPGGKVAPEAAEMMKGLKMVISGSTWIAKSGPGVSEYVAFQKAAAAANLGAFASGGVPGMQTGGLEQVMKAMADAPGVPYLTEATMSMTGSGPIVEMMKQLGAMKITNRVNSITADPIPDDMLIVPADYKVIK
jgi:hypothetical protein